MNVTLVYPPLIPGVKPQFGLQPLGVLYLASKLKSNGISVRVIDAEILGMTISQIVDEVISSAADFVGISAMTPQYPVSLELAQEIKKQRPLVKICLGGAHVNATHAEALYLCNYLDFIVYGEGENTLLEAVNKLSSGNGLQNVRGVIYKKNNTVHTNPPRPFVKNLDELPFPDFRMTPLKLYQIPYLKGRPIGSMILSRGCPYRCTFCDAHVTQGKMARKHSAERIVGELKRYSSELNITKFAFKDSTMTLDKSWCLELLHRLRQEKLGILYRCNTRADRIDAEILEALKSSGCSMILFGVESGSQDILNRMKKSTTVEQIKEAFRLTSSYGIQTYASFMIGNIGETPETARQTIELAKTINPNMVLFFYTTAYPGTELYEQALKEKLVRKDWWIRKNYFDKQYAFSKWLSGEGGKLKLKGFNTSAWIKKAYRDFYFRPLYFLKVIKTLVKDPLYIRTLLQVLPNLLSFTYSKNNAKLTAYPDETDNGS